ncbi:Maf family nucleotide pyrophosphatase [Chondrinema litorale]|uniref:Maf family nucleotide pyrophosphatase n=1 Tax=Chondrinema litorale TaxID=2994555 RepID=UPI002543A062|nr:Maf family nucleotide pyrophosphatase [Chondrinema litorale]UZR94605.1 Maf family nucleotide pyrophosphatase [Chondrinema litorale]
MKVILGSNSPRRQELLSYILTNFEVEVRSINEDYPPDMPVNEIAAYLAEQKAEAFHEDKFKDAIVITADTTVTLDDKLLEKPADKFEAKDMLMQISGRKHLVISAACVMFNGEKDVFSEVTEVYFKKLYDSEIDFYIDRYQPFDKAGAYGIQEWIGMIGIEKIVGSYYNVVGLPIHLLYKKLLELGVL